MKERIFGTESEYALYAPSEDKKRFASETFSAYIRELNELLVTTLKHKKMPYAGEFLGNGGRFYIDRGGHPEYATPECRNIRDAVIYEKAGDRLVQSLVAATRLHFEQSGAFQKLRIFKNNTDRFGNTYGSHENYLVTPEAMENIHAMIPFLVTRQIFAGAGKLSLSPATGKAHYQISQRADFFERVLSDRTRDERGIINIRRREIHRPGEKRRLHIICGDANMAEYAIFLKLGTAHLVLRLLEEDSLIHIPLLTSPVNALKSISHTFNPLLETDRGKYTATDIQNLYLESAFRFFAACKPTPEEAMILEDWSAVTERLTQLKRSDNGTEIEDIPEDLLSKTDWLLKYWLLNRYQKNHALNWHDPRLQSIDLQYHDLEPETGLFEKCQSMNLTARVAEDEEIRLAMTEPPKNTRARIRGEMIQYTANQSVDTEIENWEKIILKARPKENTISHPFANLRQMVNALHIKLDDPFQYDNSDVMEKVRQFVH